MSKPGRIACSVPHCGRTHARRDEFDQWVCGRHWRSVALRMRRFKGQCDREWRRADAGYWRLMAEGDAIAARNGGAISDELWNRICAAGARRRKALHRCHRVWERCKRLAIERAAGI